MQALAFYGLMAWIAFCIGCGLFMNGKEVRGKHNGAAIVFWNVVELLLILFATGKL